MIYQQMGDERWQAGATHLAGHQVGVEWLVPAWTNDPQEEMPGMHMDHGGMTSCEAFQTACSTKLKHTDLRPKGGVIAF